MTATPVSLVFIRPDGSGFIKAAPDVYVGKVNIPQTNNGVPFFIGSNFYAVYTFAAGDLDQGGVWRVSTMLGSPLNVTTSVGVLSTGPGGLVLSTGPGTVLETGPVQQQFSSGSIANGFPFLVRGFVLTPPTPPASQTIPVLSTGPGTILDTGGGGVLQTGPQT